jgi:hypothetical protein
VALLSLLLNTARITESRAAIIQARRTQLPGQDRRALYQHPDAQIYHSLPGLGTILTELGDDPHRHLTPAKRGARQARHCKSNHRFSLHRYDDLQVKYALMVTA